MRAQSRLSAAASGDGAFLSIPGFVGLTEVGWKGTRISLVGYPTAPPDHCSSAARHAAPLRPSDDLAEDIRYTPRAV